MLGFHPISSAPISALTIPSIFLQPLGGDDAGGGKRKKRLIEEVAKSRQPEWDRKREEQESFRAKIAALYEKIELGYEIKDAESKAIAQGYVENVRVVGLEPVSTINYDRLLRHSEHLHRLLVEYEKMILMEQEIMAVLALAI